MTEGWTESDFVPEQPAAVEPTRPSRLPLVLSSVLSALILGGAIAAPGIARLAGYNSTPTDLGDVLVFTIEDTRHTADDVEYDQTPPVGGQHADIWLACGVYDEPVRDENAVHDLEHGTVWITHAPDLSEGERSRLAGLLPENGIMSPYPDLPAPVVVTVWNAQLHLESADDERLELFLDRYADGHTAPEIGASCHGGTPDPQGGLPGTGV